MKTITSLQNPLVKHLVKLRQNRDYRYDHQTLIVEGVKIIQELSKKYPIKTLVALDESLVPKGSKVEELLIAPQDIIDKISGLQSPEGLIAEFKMPENASLNGLKKVLVLDGINDPGNLGTILRTALALGWEGIFLINESCDPYNEKALRAARGATFKIPMATGTWDDLEALIKKNKWTPLAADMKGTPLNKLEKGKNYLLILSNEAHGISDRAGKISQKVSIPMKGNMESLNVAVAGGILMHALSESL